LCPRRGRLEYASLQRLVDDKPLLLKSTVPYVAEIIYLRYYGVLPAGRCACTGFTLYGCTMSRRNFDNLKVYNDRVVKFYNDDVIADACARPRREQLVASSSFNYRLGKARAFWVG
jgi:hypothetical protein